MFFLNAGGSPAAGNFFLPRLEKVTKKKGAPDSDSRSVEREGAAKAAFAIINRSLCGCSRTPSFADRVAAAPRFGFVTWRLTGGTKNKNCENYS